MKDKPKCPRCGVPMDESDVGVDPGESMWECVGHAESCCIMVHISPIDMSEFEDEEEDE